MICNLIRKARAARLRRKLQKIDDWLAQLEDQVESGQQAIVYWRNRRTITQARLDAEDTPRAYLRGVVA